MKDRKGRTAARLAPAARVVGALAVGLFSGVLALYAQRAAPPPPAAISPGEQMALAPGPVGQYGGDLVAALRTPPKTLNPVTALDLPSQRVIALLNGDLIHINRATQEIEPGLAKAWTESRDGRRFTLELRRGVRFSDGEPFDADDVVFSFQAYLDPALHSPERDLLTVGGEPIRVRKLSPYRVEFTLARPDAAALRLFDGVAMLPRRDLEPAYRAGRLGSLWGPGSDPRAIAGLGPFRLHSYQPGRALVLERNPFYWREDAAGHRLPYLNELTFLITPSEDAEVIRFQAGDVDVLSGFGAANFAPLQAAARARDYRVWDLGAGLEYDFLFFNLNRDPGAGSERRAKLAWFADARFRQAVSAAIDRRALTRLAYQGRATPLWDQVTPGEKRWVDAAAPRPEHSDVRAEALLRAAGFRRGADGELRDAAGRPVEFSLLVNPGNAPRLAMAQLIQSDLAAVGIKVVIAPLEFQALLARVFASHDYDACLLGLVSGDADPNPEMNVWMTGGGAHLWDLTAQRPAAPWQARLDALMRRQMVTRDYAARKRLYDQAQVIVATYDPVICLVSPDVLVAARNDVANLRPAVMRDYALWNADQLYFRDPREAAR